MAREKTVKQDFAALLWPALVGVLAAAIILDKWVLERDDNTLGSAQSSYREAVSRATPSVVNIYTAKLVDTRVDRASIRRCSGGYEPIAAVGSALNARWDRASS